MSRLKIGLSQLYDGRPGRGREYIEGCAVEMERLGFHSFWNGDHIVTIENTANKYPYNEDGTPNFLPDQGWFEPTMVMLTAAAVTTTLRVGINIDLVPLRNPLIRARDIMTLDHFSGGRVDYGVGVGWAAEEFDVLDVDFKTRGAQANEHLLAMKAAWTMHRAEFHGKFVDFKDVIAFPKPIQSPHPPILVGGNSVPALRRAAVHGDGWLGWNLDLEGTEKAIERLHQELEKVGRSPSDFRLMMGCTHTGTLSDLKTMAKGLPGLGVEEYVIGVGFSQKRYKDQMAELADALLI